MVVGHIDAEPQQFRVARFEFRLDLRHIAELGGADGGEILRMREQDRPIVPNPFVEVVGPLVVWAVKSGATSLMRSDMNYPLLGDFSCRPRLCRPAAWPSSTKVTKRWILAS